MSRPAVVYVLESQRTEGAAWEPVIDEERQPLTFTGPSGKARARNLALLMTRWPSFQALRVRKNDDVDPVWSWTRKA